MRVRKWMGIGTGTLLALAMGAAHAAPPTAQQVRELMQVEGMAGTLGRMNAQMAMVMQRALPCVPASYWQGFVDAKASDQLMNSMVPIYQKHFTAEDIQGLLAFFRSPLGQKLIQESPQVMAEGMQVGRTWGQARGQQMIADLKQKGTLDDKGQCPAAPAAPAKK